MSFSMTTHSVTKKRIGNSSSNRYCKTAQSYSGARLAALCFLLPKSHFRSQYLISWLTENAQASCWPGCGGSSSQTGFPLDSQPCVWNARVSTWLCSFWVSICHCSFSKALLAFLSWGVLLKQVPERTREDEKSPSRSPRTAVCRFLPALTYLWLQWEWITVSQELWLLL